MAGVGRSSAGRRRARSGWRCGRPGWPAHPRGRCRAPAGGCPGRCRAARRWPPWRPGGPSSTSSRTWSRSTWSVSSSFSFAMPRRMASATSWAWVPSCRSRSMRRSVAAEASTVWVRACSSERTRVAMGSGPSRLRMSRRSTLTKPRITQGAAKRKMAPRMKIPTSWKKPPGWNQKGLPGKMPRTSPQTGGPPPPRPRMRSDEAGEGVPPQADGHEDAEDGPGHLDGEVGHGAPAHPVAQGRLQPPEEAAPADEGLGVLDRLAEHGPGQAALPAADAAGAADGEREDGEPEEGDGQHHAGDHGDADEGEAEHGRTARHREEGQLGPGPLREGLAHDALRQRLQANRVLLADGERQLPATDAHVHARVGRSARPSGVPPVEERGTDGQRDGRVEGHQEEGGGAGQRAEDETAPTELPSSITGMNRLGFPATS